MFNIYCRNYLYVIFFSYFALVFERKDVFFCRGEVLEWLKRHAWKACIRQKRIAGSNPAFSAKIWLYKHSIGLINNKINKKNY